MIESPWILRVIDSRKKSSPVLTVQERRMVAGKDVLQDRGRIYGESQRRCLPVIRRIVSHVAGANDQPLELQQFLPQDGIKFRGNLPLDEEAGAKLALIFKLQERIKDLDRVELIARRIERFTREEASYWLSRISNFGDDANRWAISGMKVMLGGQAADKGVEQMLEQLRGVTV